MSDPREAPAEPGIFGVNKVARPSQPWPQLIFGSIWGSILHIYIKPGVTTKVFLLAVGLNVQKLLRAGWDEAVTSIDDDQE